jgi:RNA polymerase sigma-70 factor (ECF subfamily)
MADGSDDLLQLLHSAANGNQPALGELLDRYRGRLRHMVRLRMDRRIRGRVDPSDVIQETFVEAFQRLGEYLKNPSVTFVVWLRYLAAQRLQMLHRHHLGVHARDVRREVSPCAEDFPGAESAVLTAHLLARLTSPSTAAARAELKVNLLGALAAMEPIDREILALRHFEQLSNAEVAEELRITPTAASNRYVRALERFRPIVSAMPGGGPASQT